MAAAGGTAGGTSGGTSGGTAAPPHPETPLLEGGDGTEEELARDPPELPAPAFLRQVAAICAYPALLEYPEIPEGVKRRARRILGQLQGGSPGSYNLEYVTGPVAEQISRFLEHRDGIPCDPRDVTPCSGTAAAIVDVLSLLVDPRSAVPTGVLVPAPGPPLAALAAGLAGAVPIPYPLEEAREGAPDVAAIRRELRDARGRCTPKVLWVGNPGHPTGPALSPHSMLALLSLAFEESLLLLADEVHQERSLSLSRSRPFVSFRRALLEAGPPLSSSVQLVSFYSLSKGMAGGGFRAGFFDLVNIDRRVLRSFYTWGLSVYPPILGMAMLDVAMDTPQDPDSAYEAMQEHRRALSRSLSRNSRRVPDVPGSVPGIRCPTPTGGPRTFPGGTGTDTGQEPGQEPAVAAAAAAAAGAGPAAPQPLPKPFPAGMSPRDTEPGTAPRGPRAGGGL